MRDIDDLFGGPDPDDEQGTPEPDRLATDSLDALRDDELGGRDAHVDPALAAVAETGGLDAEDEDLDDDDLGATSSYDDLFDPVDDDELDEDDEDEDADWDE